MSHLRFRYQTIEFDTIDIHLRSLRDNQEFSDNLQEAADLGISSASWPLFGIVWESSQVLAHRMLDFDIAGKRILEVGCGIALASHLLNNRNANITATDYHPEAGNFLDENVKLNHAKHIPFVRTGWADEKSTLGKFDVIIGSDLLYESNHVDLLANFLHQHADAHCEIILVDPGRGHHARFSKKMLELSFTHTQHKPNTEDYLEKPFKGQVLRYLR
jgi:predicted nicotinamide N-methyase